MKYLLRIPASSSIALAILVAWCLSAAFVGQSIFATQRSLWLPQLGGATGELFANHEWWRLLASQFLHVHLLHMVFNVMCIFLVGGLIELLYGWRVLLLIYFVGGTTGQTASVLSYPTLVSDGASQALMALCGAGVLLLPRPSARLVAISIVAIQVALDLHAAGTIKAGHCFGFGAGFLIGACILGVSRYRSGAARPNKTLQPTAPKDGAPVER
jgi:membrane associated rhomboid family serine protease